MRFSGIGASRGSVGRHSSSPIRQRSSKLFRGRPVSAGPEAELERSARDAEGRRRLGAPCQRNDRKIGADKAGIFEGTWRSSWTTR
jgi:hypothetical protein